MATKPITAEGRRAKFKALAHAMILEVTRAAHCSAARATRALEDNFARMLADCVADGRPVHPDTRELYIALRELAK